MLKGETSWSFDSEETRAYTKVRQEFAREFLVQLQTQIQLLTALDVGCGVGYFSDFLQRMGFEVCAIDGRTENVAEGKRRYPDIKFLTRDIEDAKPGEIGSFDFVLCVGLLYHLENPFRAIRNLQALTEKVLLIESMCAPGTDATLLLLDENEFDNQGLNYVAFYPTEQCLVKMLHKSGFPFVYRFVRLPDEKQFLTTVWRKRSRTFLAASKIALPIPNLFLVEDKPQFVLLNSDPWATGLSRVRNWATSRILRRRHY
jgi:SAM-dependent methyltransferase